MNFYAIFLLLKDPLLCWSRFFISFIILLTYLYINSVSNFYVYAKEKELLFRKDPYSALEFTIANSESKKHSEKKLNKLILSYAEKNKYSTYHVTNVTLQVHHYNDPDHETFRDLSGRVLHPSEPLWKAWGGIEKLGSPDLFIGESSWSEIFGRRPEHIPTRLYVKEEKKPLKAKTLFKDDRKYKFYIYHHIYKQLSKKKDIPLQEESSTALSQEETFQVLCKYSDEGFKKILDFIKTADVKKIIEQNTCQTPENIKAKQTLILKGCQKDDAFTVKKTFEKISQPCDVLREKIDSHPTTNKSAPAEKVEKDDDSFLVYFDDLSSWKKLLTTPLSSKAVQTTKENAHEILSKVVDFIGFSEKAAFYLHVLSYVVFMLLLILVFMVISPHKKELFAKLESNGIPPSHLLLFYIAEFLIICLFTILFLLFVYFLARLDIKTNFYHILYLLTVTFFAYFVTFFILKKRPSRRRSST